MGLGHIKPGITAARAAGTGIFHPTLGVEAVGVIEGEPIWPVAGGAEDGDGDGDGDDDDTDGDGDDDGDDDGDGDDDDADGSKAKIAALTEEKDRHYKRRKKAEADRDAEKARADKAEAELAKLRGKKPAKKAAPKKGADADVDDDDDTDDSDLVAERAARARDKEVSDALLRKERIENAFLASRQTLKIEWVNPGQVMTLLLADDDYEVEFDENGIIDRKSLVAELKRFAKANPHLVKPKPKAEGEGGEGDAGSSGKTGGTSGSSMNGRRKGKAAEPPSREQLAKKYPALNVK